AAVHRNVGGAHEGIALTIPRRIACAVEKRLDPEHGIREPGVRVESSDKVKCPPTQCGRADDREVLEVIGASVGVTRIVRGYEVDAEIDAQTGIGIEPVT